MQLEVELPSGTIGMFVIARFFGKTKSGPGAGVEIYLMGETEKTDWMNFYRAGVHQLKEVDLADLAIEELAAEVPDRAHLLSSR